VCPQSAFGAQGLRPPKGVSDPLPEIVYVYDAEKVIEKNKMVILSQLYTEASIDTIQDISTTTDEEASTATAQIVTENTIEQQYEINTYYINNIGVCFVTSVICIIIIIMIYCYKSR